MSEDSERKEEKGNGDRAEARFGLKIDGFQVTGCEEVVRNNQFDLRSPATGMWR